MAKRDEKGGPWAMIPVRPEPLEEYLEGRK